MLTSNSFDVRRREAHEVFRVGDEIQLGAAFTALLIEWEIGDESGSFFVRDELNASDIFDDKIIEFVRNVIIALS